MHTPTCTACLSPFSTYFRMTPPFLALAACISGIAFAIFWNYMYLAIPFSLGIFGSIYSMYLAYQYNDLQSLTRANQTLPKHVNDFKKEQANFEQNTQALEEEIRKIKAENQQFCAYAKEFREIMMEVSGIFQTNQELSKEAYEKFCDKLKALEKNKVHHGKIITDLTSTVGDLSKLLDVMRGDKSVQKNLETLRQFQEKQIAIQAQIGAQEGALKALEEQVSTMDKINVQLTQVLQGFSQENKRQSQVVVDIKNLAKDITDAVQTFKLLIGKKTSS